jgi:hypothetical protein
MLDKRLRDIRAGIEEMAASERSQWEELVNFLNGLRRAMLSFAIIIATLLGVILWRIW